MSSVFGAYDVCVLFGGDVGVCCIQFCCHHQASVVFSVDDVSVC